MPITVACVFLSFEIHRDLAPPNRRTYHRNQSQNVIFLSSICKEFVMEAETGGIY